MCTPTPDSEYFFKCLQKSHSKTFVLGQIDDDSGPLISNGGGHTFVLKKYIYIFKDTSSLTWMGLEMLLHNHQTPFLFCQVFIEPKINIKQVAEQIQTGQGEGGLTHLSLVQHW